MAKAKLITLDAEPVQPGLGTVRGWRSDDDPFLAAVDKIVNTSSSTVRALSFLNRVRAVSAELSARYHRVSHGAAGLRLQRKCYSDFGDPHTTREYLTLMAIAF